MYLGMNLFPHLLLMRRKCLCRYVHIISISYLYIYNIHCIYVCMYNIHCIWRDPNQWLANLASPCEINLNPNGTATYYCVLLAPRYWHRQSLTIGTTLLALLVIYYWHHTIGTASHLLLAPFVLLAPLDSNYCAAPLLNCCFTDPEKRGFLVMCNQKSCFSVQNRTHVAQKALYKHFSTQKLLLFPYS